MTNSAKHGEQTEQEKQTTMMATAAEKVREVVEPKPLRHQKPQSEERLQSEALEKEVLQKEVLKKEAVEGVKPKLFGKWSYDVEIRDSSLASQISLRPLKWPHTWARHATKPFAKRDVNIVERLANKLMRGGTGKKVGGRVIRTHGALQGKKLRVLKVIEKAFDAIAAQTRENPLQVFIRALENAAPCEDVTRVEYGGIVYQVAVDVSAQRRLDLALRHIALAALIASFDSPATLDEALAKEVIAAAANDPASGAIKRRFELERMAKAAR